jgi:hypothetical protein
MNHKDKAYPKMTRTQARYFWKSLTPQQKIDFNKFMQKLENKELTLKSVNVDDEEQIQNIVLEKKKR